MSTSVAQRTPGARRSVGLPPATAPIELSAADLRLRSLLSGLAKGSPALILLCIYITFEYLRPQQMYPVIDVIPWGLTTILLCSFAALLTRERTAGLNAMDILCLLFMCVLVISMFTAYSPAAAFNGWTTAGTMALMYFCVRQILSSPQRLLLFTLFFILVNFKFSQHSTRVFAGRGFSFSHWGVAGSGWFHNSGELAMQMGVGFFISLCVLLALKPWVQSRWRWWLLLALFPGTMMITVAASSSRGSQLALLAGVILMLIKPPQIFRKLIVLVLVVGLFVYLVPQEQMDRFRAAGEDGTSQTRLEYWEIGKQILRDNPGGIGFQNWSAYYGAYYWDPSIHRRVEVSHNSFLDAFVELGYHGGALFLLLLMTAFLVNLRVQARLKSREDCESVSVRAISRGVNLGLLVTCIAGAFMSVLYHPVFWLAFAMTSALRQVSLRLVENPEQSLPASSGDQHLPGHAATVGPRAK